MKRQGMIWAWWCAVFAMMLMGHSAFAQMADRCGQYAACGPCAADPQCGWCAGNGRCMSGNEQGSPYCPGGWAWTDNQCGGFNGQDACWRHHECGHCAADPQCGWCGSTGRCLSGSEQGSPYCPAGWAWTDNQCGGYAPSYAADPCSHFTNCGQCAADAHCGWCAASGRCMSGTQQGSPYCQGGWAWTDNQCRDVTRATPMEACGRFRDCNSCAADPQCGWCGATHHCVGGGTAQGSPYCPGAWAWTANQCTYGYAVPVTPNAPPNQCGAFHDCNSCAAQAQCGWCGATGQCMVGEANGAAYCPGAWAWTDNQCGQSM